MRRFEREVVDYKLIEAMLQEMNIINVGMNDEDGFPYVVPMSFGFEMTDAHLNENPLLVGLRRLLSELRTKLARFACSNSGSPF